MTTPPADGPSEPEPEPIDDHTFKTLKYSLLGPSLTKAGQDKVDQNKVSSADDSLCLD